MDLVSNCLKCHRPALVVLLLMPGVAAAQTDPGRSLVGTQWHAIELAGKPFTLQGDPREAQLVFDRDGRVAGSDGCNRVTGTYALKDDRVSFSKMAGTQMACANSAGTEKPFHDALAGATRLTITGNRLELHDSANKRLAVFAADVRGTSGAALSGLGGTSWQLVKFQGGDDTILTPDARSEYTLRFDSTGTVAAQIDCNRGRGTWTSNNNSQIQLGPLSLTRAICPKGSMHDQIVRQWGNIRSYVIRDDHLFLALMADGGIYEFAPLAQQSAAPKSSVTSKGPFTWTCTGGNALPVTVRVTLYETQPAMALVERGGTTIPAFQVRTASGARYDGEGVMFWEARGEAMLTWMGAESTCTRN